MAPPSKKRKTNSSAPEQIDFDFSAREEYLTGFHKRKLQRAKLAQEEAAKKEREERLRMRAELRKQRKEDLERHVSEVNRLVKQANPDLSSADEASSGDEEEQWDGIPDAAPETINQEDEYIDEDKYTTVTIETVGISKHGFEKRGGAGSDEEGDDVGSDVEKKKRVWTKEKPKSTRPKKKKIKFRYETKAERKAERVKQGVKKKRMREKRAEK